MAVGAVFHPSGFFIYGYVADPSQSAFALGPGAPANFATGINDAGTLVGNIYDASDRRWLGYTWNAANPNMVGTLYPSGSARDVFAQAINASGVSVGWNGYSHERRAVGYDAHGIGVDLGTLAGGAWSAANAINSAGIAVGLSDSPLGVLPVIFAGNGVSAVALPPGSSAGEALSINDANTIVGRVSTANGERGFFISNGIVSLLDPLDHDTSASAADINNSGHIVGLSSGADGGRGFVIFNSLGPLALTSLLNLSGAGWLVTEATSINDNGWIAATAIDPRTGLPRGVLLEPIGAIPIDLPEPPIMLLLMLLLVVVATAPNIRTRQR